MWDDLMRALCLMLVLEGLWPTIAPARWRGMVANLAQTSPQGIRQIGITCMVLGAAGLYALAR